MAVEDHPIYPRWRAAVERVIKAKERRTECREGTPAYTAADDEYQQALIAYDMIARQV
jgi:hypothetical protein